MAVPVPSKVGAEPLGRKTRSNPRLRIGLASSSRTFSRRIVKYRPPLRTRAGGGHAQVRVSFQRGQRKDAGAPRGERRGPRRDDPPQASGPSRIHDHDRGMQRVRQNGKVPAGTEVPDRHRSDEGRGEGEAASRGPKVPAPRLRPERREVLDARDDGHGPERRAERRCRRRSREEFSERAVRLGRAPSAPPDVRPNRAGHRRPEI